MHQHVDESRGLFHVTVCVSFFPWNNERVNDNNDDEDDGDDDDDGSPMVLPA